jgi:hypothetical protein
VSLPVHPLNRNAQHPALSRHEQQRASRRKRDVRVPERRHALDPIQHGHRRTGRLETVEIEGHGEQRATVHEDQMAARQIPAVVAATLHDASWTIRQRLHDDVRVLEVARLAVRREQAALPPRSACGQRCVISPFALSSVVSGSGDPPSDDTRTSADRAHGERKMLPSSAHVAPRALSAAMPTEQIVTGRPPAIAIFFSLAPARKPIHFPSGENNGLSAPSVPACSVAWGGQASARRVGSSHLRLTAQ